MSQRMILFERKEKDAFRRKFLLVFHVPLFIIFFDTFSIFVLYKPPRDITNF